MNDQPISPTPQSPDGQQPMALNAALCSAFVGKTVEDEEHGRGTIVGHENGMIFVQLDPPGCRMLTIPETALVPNH